MPPQTNLTPFVGGQIIIQDLTRDYMARGEVAWIEQTGDILNIRLNWLAQKDDGVLGSGSAYTAVSEEKLLLLAIPIVRIFPSGHHALVVEATSQLVTYMLIQPGSETSLEKRRVKGF